MDDEQHRPDQPISLDKQPPPQYDQQQRQPPYGEAQYGQPQYGQPQYGQPQYGQPQYGQPQYGQPSGGQSYGPPPPYGQSQYPPPPPYGYPPAYGYPPLVAKPVGWFVVNWLFFWPTAIYSLFAHFLNIDRAAYAGDLNSAHAHAASVRKLGIIALCLGIGLFLVIIVFDVAIFSTSFHTTCVSSDGSSC